MEDVAIDGAHVIVVRGNDDGFGFEFGIRAFEEADDVAAFTCLKIGECFGQADGAGWNLEGVGVGCAVDFGLEGVGGFSAGGEKLVGDFASDGEDGDVPHLAGQCVGWAAGGALGAGRDWLDRARDSILNDEDSGDALFAQLFDLLPEEGVIGIECAHEF